MCDADFNCTNAYFQIRTRFAGRFAILAAALLAEMIFLNTFVDLEGAQSCASHSTGAFASFRLCTGPSRCCHCTWGHQHAGSRAAAASGTHSLDGQTDSLLQGRLGIDFSPRSPLKIINHRGYRAITSKVSHGVGLSWYLRIFSRGT